MLCWGRLGGAGADPGLVVSGVRAYTKGFDEGELVLGRTLEALLLLWARRLAVRWIDDLGHRWACWRNGRIAH